MAARSENKSRLRILDMQPDRAQLLPGWSPSGGRNVRIMVDSGRLGAGNPARLTWSSLEVDFLDRKHADQPKAHSPASAGSGVVSVPLFSRRIKDGAAAKNKSLVQLGAAAASLLAELPPGCVDLCVVFMLSKEESDDDPSDVPSFFLTYGAMFGRPADAS